MKERKRALVALSALALAAGLVMGVVYAYVRPEVRGDADARPEVIVEAYYKLRLEKLNAKPVVDDVSLNPKFVTQHLRDSFATLQTEYAAEGIPFDPFFCAQDFPEDAAGLSVRLISESENGATVSAKIMSHWPPIKISLVNQDGWKIDRIECSTGTAL